MISPDLELYGIESAIFGTTYLMTGEEPETND
jgi:hypothetical protein